MPRGSKSRQANYETRRRAPNNSSQIELDPPKDLKPSKTTTGASRNTPAVAPKGNTHTHTEEALTSRAKRRRTMKK